MKCKNCGQKIGFNKLMSQLCSNCEQTEKASKIITDGINKIRDLVENARENPKNKKIIHREFDNMVNGLYSTLYSSVINSLNMSFESSESRIFPEEMAAFRKMIKPWSTQIQESENSILKEDYTKFKIEWEKLKKHKLRSELGEGLEMVENTLRLNEQVNQIDDFVREFNDEQINEKIVTLKRTDRNRQIREEAEKRLYGEVKKGRDALSKEEKEQIFSKYDFKCAICGVEGGLHIHHKDKNPKNNVMSNLILLCGVCHKKIHMNVR